MKLIRAFKIDPIVYSKLRSDDEKQDYLMTKMEEDIREGLKNLNSTLIVKKEEFAGS